MALGADEVDRHPHQRQLQQHQVPLQVGEARAGEAGGALHVDQAELGADRQVIAWLEVEAGHLAYFLDDHRVLVGDPVGGVVVGDVRQQQGQFAERPLERLQLLFARVDALAQGRHRGDLRLGIAALAFDLADPLRGGVALRLRVLDFRQQLASAGVEGEQLVDLATSAAARQSRLDPLGFGAEQLQVEHGEPTVLTGRSSGPGAASFRRPTRRTWRRIWPPLRLLW